jgi:hypothetical protein
MLPSPRNQMRPYRLVIHAGANGALASRQSAAAFVPAHLVPAASIDSNHLLRRGPQNRAGPQGGIDHSSLRLALEADSGLDHHFQWRQKPSLAP